METLSLISLIVDYEVPPALIISAIDDRKLRPILTQRGLPRIETVAFSIDEVRNLFWAYELKQKAAETRTELIRRFTRYDAIVAAIIGSVVASGVTAFATHLVEKGAQGGACNPPHFHLPYSSSGRSRIMGLAADRLTFSDPWGFELLATAEGTTGFGPALHGICVYHRDDWISEYVPGTGLPDWIAGAGQTVLPGDPVLRMSSVLPGEATATFRIYRRSGADFEAWSLLDTDWPIFPAEWRQTR